MNKEILLFGLSPVVVSVLILFLMVVMLVSQITALLLVIPVVILAFFLRRLSKKGNTDLINSYLLSSKCPESVEDNKNLFRYLITDKKSLNSDGDDQGID